MDIYCVIPGIHAPEVRARSPIAKKIWETHECEKFWFGYDVTSVHPTVRPSVRNPTMLMHPCLFGGKLHGEIVWQDAFTTEMLKNKKHKDNLYVFVGYVDKRGKKRKREKEKKSGDD